MLGCYYSRNSGISPLFKEVQYVFRQKVEYFVYDAENSRECITRYHVGTMVTVARAELGSRRDDRVRHHSIRWETI